MNRNRRMNKTSALLLAVSALLLWLMASPTHAHTEALKSEADVQKFTVRVT